MFEKRKRLRVRSILEKQFTDIKELDQVVKVGDLAVDQSASKTVFFHRSTNERNMTRKTRSRQFHSAFQSGYCAVCHIPYSSLEDHIQSKRHLKLNEEDGNFISIKGFDSFLALDGIDALEVNDKSCDYSLYQRRSKMPRTRTSSVMYDRVKESPLSPVGSDSGHHLRSRKNINYMTPPLEEDSLTEKPEVVKEYRELRSSTRLLAKLTEQMVDSDDVWNSGRPKRSCNKQRISADERLVVDNKSYYKVEVLPTKLRSGVGVGAVPEKRSDTPVEEDDKSSRAIKKRYSEVIRLNNEAENFLFPKKQDSSDDENEEDQTKPITHEEVEANKTVKVENDESASNTCSENKIKKKRRTHAELFISENQKYYKFETPGSSSRLRYQGSYLAVGNKSKNNGESTVKTESKEAVKPVDNEDNEFTLNLDDYNFSFENVPKSEDWYQAFERLDTGEEKYAYLNDENYWDSMILPYQLDYVPPLDPNECLTQYNQIKKCLLEPPSTSTSVTCSTPDLNASNSSMDAPFDDDSKISATENSSNSSAMEEMRPRRHKRKLKGAFHAVTGGNGKNPRKSPRQHASTLAILSSLIHQRKKKAAARKSAELERRNLSTIEEEPKVTAKKTSLKDDLDYSTITKNFEDEIAAICDDNQEEQILVGIDFGDDGGEEISFNGRFSVEDVFNLYENSKNVENNSPRKRLLHAKPGRKPGKRKKNRTGWPMNRSRRSSKRCFNVKDEEMEDSAVESVAADGIESGEEGGCDGINSIDDSITHSGKDSELGKLNSENNNKNDQSSLGDVNIDDTTTNCDLNNSDRVGRNNDNSKSDDNGSDKVLTTKVNNNGDTNNIEYQPIVCVQKLDKGHIDNKSDNNTNNTRRSSSPKRTNRGQRRMPASPKSPRMLRRPRGRWYRER